MDARMPIPLMGINHNIPDQEVPDGHFHELINLRHKDQSLRPIPKKVRADCPQAKLLHKHQIDVNTYAYIGVTTVGDDNFIAYYLYQYGVLVANVNQAYGVESDWDLAFADLGLTLMITDRITNTTNLLIYKSDPTPYYSLFTDFIPDIFSPSCRWVADSNRNITNTGIQLPVNDAASHEDAKLAEYVKIIEEALNEGTLVGKYLVRIAYELFDGSIVRPTIPVLATVSTIAPQTFTLTTSWIEWSTVLTGRNLEINLNMDSNYINHLQTNWKEYIRSVNIYITDTWKPGELTWKNSETSADYRKGDMAVLGRKKGLSETRLRMDGAWKRGAFIIEDWEPDLHESAYFLLKSIELADLATGWIDLTPEEDPLTDIMFRTNMPFDQGTHHKISGDTLFSYNSRYFLGNVTTKLYKGFPLTGLITPPDNVIVRTAYDLGMEFDIQTIQGIRTVFTGWYSFTYGTSSMQCLFTIQKSDTWYSRKYWGYPDARAKTCRILIRQSGTTRLVISLKMESVPEMNFARTIARDMIIGGEEDYGAFNISSFSPTTLVSDMDSITDHNRIQACEFENPLYYPLANSYNMEGEVRGLATNAVAVSQGQFGQYPLFAFTSRGIWALNIGNGDVLISSMAPVSRYVLSNTRSILMVDGAVVFITTEGLMLISGSEPVQEFGEQLERVVDSPLVDINDYQTAVNNPNIYQAAPYFDATDFLTYLQSAIMAYDPQEAEIIISNSAYSYSLVFCLKTKMWHKISQSWVNFIADYPKWLGLASLTGTYYIDDLSQEDPSETEPIMIHAETRAIKFGEPMSRKQLKRFLLVSTIVNAPEQVFAFYLFGSPEMKEYYMQISSTNIIPGENTLIGRSTFSCKAFIITFGGWVLKATSIGAMVADIEKRYTDKLR